jgi:acetolactate synthase-1/2/3 large subunit
MELAGLRGRDDSFERALVGTSTRDPRPDYAGLAESFDIRGFGPVTDPSDRRETLRVAWETVRDGEPVLVDVHCQPR